MGKQESENRKGARRNEIKRTILHILHVAENIHEAVLTRRVITDLSQLGIGTSGRQSEFIRAARRRLVKQGLLTYQNGFIRLTSAGQRALRALALNNYQIPKSRRWDKKWRVLIFDIPEYRKGLREKVRRTLMAIGFKRLQDSVWAYPYDCEDLITLLKADFRIGKDLLYLIVDSIENDGRLRREFNLE